MNEVWDFVDVPHEFGRVGCHFMQRSSPATGKGKGKKAGSWESFVKNNPKRII
jgi:hypothetical protein